MATNEKLILTDDLKLGDGNHKIVYAHPTDKNLCVKILFTTPDTDFDKEMRYRQALGNRVDKMTLMTKYYGEVETNKGKGYVFERVLDFDGSTCKTVLQHLQNPVSTDDLTDLLLNFKKAYINEKFIAAGTDPDNYLVQRTSPTERRVRIIDNIGTAAKFPLLYYSDFLMAKRARKYWKRFVKEISIEYSNVITKNITDILIDS